MSAFDFLKIKKTVNDLQSHIVKLRDELRSLQVEREKIARSPATREDVKNFLFSRIEKKGSDYSRVFDDLTHGLAIRPDRMNRTSDAPVMTATRGDMAVTPFTIEGAACAFLDGVLKQGISAAIDAAPWPADAMPIADRQRQLEILDTSIAKLTSDEGEILRHAHESGLTIY
jgi:hypothetical protein